MAAMELQREWDIEDRDEARAYSRQALKNLVIDAEEAGFNPLTALGATGGANYNAAAGFAPLSRKAPVRQAVGGSPLGDAISDFGTNFMENFDPYRDTKREQEYRLIESQISALNAGALSGAPRGAASFAQGDVERRPSGGAGALRKTTGNAPGEGTLVGGDDPTVSSMGLNDGKYGWFHWPSMPDGETVETVYGDSEILSTLYGGVKFIGDGVYSAYRNVKQKSLDDRKADFDPKYQKWYRDNIRDSVPSLAR